ncbi:MAG: hypothetical protein DSY77_15635 [Bacteroidetes bacterium]|nr:MAG: hypothetical protein DSY77_15635 [Bacteroidota bacterium]
MKNLMKNKLWAGLILILSVMWSCEVTEENNPPSAVATSEVRVELGTTTTLDGSASSDVDGDDLTYEWTLVDAPGPNLDNLSNSNSAVAQFQPIAAGNFTFQLTVSDPAGASDTDEVTIEVFAPANESPNAVILDENGDEFSATNDNITFNVGSELILNGEASSDPEGDAISYEWAVENAPTGSAVTFSAPESANTTVVVDTEGEYTISLLVRDGEGGENKAQITVEAEVAPVEIGGSISENTTLENVYENPDLPDYRAISTLDVLAGVVLTIEPGVTIEFVNATRLELDGRIVAVGTAEDSIKFTGVEKVKGFWDGITVFSDENQNILEYAVVEFGGGEARGFGLPKTNIGVDGGYRLRIKNSTIRESDGYGVYFDGGTVQEFSNNHFEGNNLSPLSITAMEVAKLDNASTYTGNNRFIEIQGSGLTGTTETVWPVINDGTPYRVMGNLNIDGGLSIQAGATFEFTSGTRMEIDYDGYVKALGTESDKITFKGSEESVGFWLGVTVFSNNLNNQFDHCVFAHGGSEARGFGLEAANLAVDGGAQVTISNSEFYEANGYGIFIESNGELKELSNSIIRNNTGIAAAVDINSIHNIDNITTFNDGNGDNSVAITGTTLNQNTNEVTWNALSNGTPYYVRNNTSIESGLNLSPGVNIEVGTDRYLDVDNVGYIIADGESTGISITGKTKSPGAWQGIQIWTNDTRNLLNNVTVSHGGSSARGFGIPESNIGVDGSARLTVTNCNITDCDGTGLFGESGSTVTQSGNTFSNNLVDIDLN